MQVLSNIGSCNNFIIINLLSNIIDESDYDHINRTILDGNVTNMSLIIYKRNFGAIDADENSCHRYSIINFSESPYTLQEYLNI